MTFCLGMKVRDGLVGISDTRVTTGSECITAKKVSSWQLESGSLFLMTSGLRAVRDKTLTYFEDALEYEGAPPDRMFKAANLFAAELRRVMLEDKEAIEESGLHFNIHCLMGGQLSHDKEHKLYLIYPQGNWVEIGEGTPYYIIGATGYGKPVLDRTLTHQDTMKFALKVGCLAFDSTRISAADVDFPIDTVLYARDSFQIIEERYDKDTLSEMSNWWQDQLRRLVREIPSSWIDDLLQRLPDAPTNLSITPNQQVG